MKTIPLIFIIGLLFSCQETKSPEKLEKTKKEQVKPVHANSQIDFSVEGMVCQMGCGGSMRKELKKTGGVDRVEVNFVEGEKEQFVKVTYDSLLISSKQISSILNRINDQQFTAKPIAKKAI